MWVPPLSSGAWDGHLSIGLSSHGPHASHASQQGPLRPKYPSSISTTTCGCGASPFHISTLLSTLYGASTTNLDFNTSIQLAFS